MTTILQNQKKNNFLKPFKEQALKDIQISITEWNEFQKKNFFFFEQTAFQHSFSLRRQHSFFFISNKP